MKKEQTGTTEGAFADSRMKKRMILEITMAALLPFLMAYSMTGGVLHEFGGIAMAILYAAHCVVNRRWFKNLRKGTFTAARVVNTATDLMLLTDMVIMMVSGIMISRHAAPFLSFGESVPFWHALHAIGAYWGLVLMSVHSGFHAGMMAETLGIKKHEQASDILRAAALVISQYGIYAVVKRGLLQNLLLKQAAAVTGDSLLLFLVDYISMMVLIATATYYLLKALKVTVPKAVRAYR